MSTAYSDDMNQIATYWSPEENTEFGQKTLGSPVEIACRWEDKSEMFRDSSGVERTSAAVVYPDRELVVGGWLMIGSHVGVSDPRGLEGTYPIGTVGSSPDLDTDEVLYKAML